MYRYVCLKLDSYAEKRYKAKHEKNCSALFHKSGAGWKTVHFHKEVGGAR